MQIRDATERRWFVLKRPRRNINGGSETEVTVTSKRHAQAGRAKRCKREEKPASIGGAAYLLQGLAIGLDPVVDLTPLPAAPLPLTDTEA